MSEASRSAGGLDDPSLIEYEHPDGLVATWVDLHLRGVRAGEWVKDCDRSMAARLARRRRPWWFLGLAVVAVVVVTGASGSWVVWRHFHQGQRMRIPGRVVSPFAPWPTPAPSRQATAQAPPFAT